MVGIVYETDTVEAPVVEVEADETAAAENHAQPATGDISLPLRTLHNVKTIDVRVVSFPARRVTIEGMRRVTTSRPTADEVNG